MVSAHAHFLADEENYTRGTNHGLDQSIALYRVAAQSPDTVWQKSYAELAADRITDEVSYAFASDGGHRENSVQYHNFGILQLLKIRKLQEETENLKIPKVSSIEKTLGLATTNFAHLIGPGATLHQIGDTAIQPLKDIIKGTKLPRGYKHYRYSITKGVKGQPPAQTSLVLPESGWISFRNHWEDNTAVHLLSHCGFTSNYHRHDDDGSFSLKAFGENWIIDSGLYQYKERNPYRRYMRSYKAHSLLAPTGASPHRRFDRYEERSKITAYHLSNTHSYVAMKSMMFEGYSVNRSLDFQVEARTKNVKITVSDSASPSNQKTAETLAKKIEAGETTYTTRFILPMDKDIKIDANSDTIHVIGQTHIMHISGDVANTHIISGVEEPEPDGWRSKEFGSLMPSQVLEIRKNTHDVAGTYQISWSEKDTL